MKNRKLKRILEKVDDVDYKDVDPCFSEPPKEEPLKTEERNWISLGNRMFHIEDVQSMYIQANHLIINFDYTDKQVVIFFGYGEKNSKAYQNCLSVFEMLGSMYGAKKIDLPDDADMFPDIMKTAYGDKINREIANQVFYKNKEYKERHKKKYQKCINELEELKKKMDGK